MLDQTPDQTPDQLDGNASPTGGKAGGSPLGLILLIVGSVGVAGAIAVDGMAVLGRHVGAPLAGSIEMSQVAVVLLASCAIAMATLGRGHAVVDLVHQRLPKPAQRILLRFAAFLSFIFMASVAVGSAWVTADLWTGSERTELYDIPLQWLRLLWIACASTAALAFLFHVFRAGGGSEA